jgi:hypothetical protein
MSAVSDLLSASRASHLAYQQNIPRKAAQGATLVTVPGNPDLARSALQAAYDARLAAHQADPTHQDSSWFMDPVAHSSLMAFYTKELAK